jgi:hypothetical protein
MGNTQDNYQQSGYPMLNENQIILYQLNLIVQRLYELYANNEPVQMQLRQAIELLNMGNIDTSADALHVH